MLLNAFRLDGKTAIVTGAGKGIGASIAKSFAEMGANVFCVARSIDDIEQVAEACRGFGVKAEAIACDVTKEDQLKALVARVAEHSDRLDILVNNAGAPGKGWGSIEKVDMGRFEHTVRINLNDCQCLIGAQLDGGQELFCLRGGQGRHESDDQSYVLRAVTQNSGQCGFSRSHRNTQHRLYYPK
jgi:NAD(P)-dependent dehydrogenase (short-subunit alcohol dehydrogenase family)